MSVWDKQQTSVFNKKGWRLWFSCIISFSHIGPVDNIINSLHVIRTQVLILKVVCMFPHINSKKGNKTCCGLKWILVGTGSNHKMFIYLVVPQPTPTWTLHCHWCCVESFFEILKGAKVSLDSFQQVTCWFSTTIRRKICPKYTVIDVPSTIEFKCWL